MSIVGPRSRLVYFRLSEKEFEELNSLCTGDEGARSVSQISRAAVQAFLSRTGETDDGLKREIKVVSERISEIDGKLEQLAELIAQEPLLKPRARSRDRAGDNGADTMVSEEKDSDA